MKVLVVEDKRELANALKEYLSLHKILCDISLDGEEGYQIALRGQYDVIVLDLMLPSKSGNAIIKDLRDNKIATPILVLTAKVATDDKVECLLAGADDYLTKPFVLDELLARLYVLTRRQPMYVPNEIPFSDIKLDVLNHTLTNGQDKIALSMKEFQIMELLIKNTEQIVYKKTILQRVWGSSTETAYNSAEVYISFLRKKVEALSNKVVIKSIRGCGYRLMNRVIYED